MKRKEMRVHPVGTKKNVSDLNTKPLTVNRRRFLLHFLSAVMMTSESNFEAVGEAEFAEHVLSEQVRSQIHQMKAGLRGKQCQYLLQMILLSQMCTGSMGQPQSETQNSGWNEFFLLSLFLGLIGWLWYNGAFQWQRAQEYADLDDAHVADLDDAHVDPFESMSPRAKASFRRAEDRFLGFDSPSSSEPFEPGSSDLEGDEPDPEELVTSSSAEETAESRPSGSAESSESRPRNRRIQLPPEIEEDFQRFIYERIQTVQSLMSLKALARLRLF